MRAASDDYALQHKLRVYGLCGQGATADDTSEPAAKRARLESGAAAETSGAGPAPPGVPLPTESLMQTVTSC